MVQVDHSSSSTVDQIIDSEIVKAVSTAHDTTATLSIIEGAEADSYGAVRMADGEITTLTEQPASGEFRLFNAGVYAFTQEIFETLETLSVDRGELPLTDGESAADEIADETLMIPETNKRAAPVLANVQLQLFSYHLAYELGWSIDKPRNLAKSVTVE